MRKVQVALGSRSYDIEIEEGLLAQVGAKVHALLPQAETVAVITDSNVGPLYGETVRKGLEEAGVRAPVLTFPAGEESKNLATLGRLYEGLARAGVTRSDAVLALGGGVTGDMAGLAAATFLRGVAFVQVPTSLLAAVDSSVGGKVAVDLPCGKNLVGAFLQPRAVYIDPDMLRTLPARFLHDGMAEVIKYGCIFDADLFDRLGRIHSDAELLAAADGIIERCCAHKARVVERDELEQGERMLLNFGHTLGHAVEKGLPLRNLFPRGSRRHRHGAAHPADGTAGPDGTGHGGPHRGAAAAVQPAGGREDGARRFPADHRHGQEEAGRPHHADCAARHRGQFPPSCRIP